MTSPTKSSLGRIASTAIVHPEVDLGENAIIEDYCIIGAPITHSNPTKTRIGKNAIIRSHSVIYAGNQIGDHFQTGNGVNVRECNTIGDHVSIGTGSVIEHHVTLHNRVRVHSQVFIPEYSVLEDDVWVGPNTVLTNAKFPQSPNVKEHLTGPHLKRKAKVGANTTILPGIIVEENALIGAGSVVVKNVESNTIVAGNPAKLIRNIPY